MHHITPYIPEMSVEGLINLIENENLSIKVVIERITKHGDCLLYTSDAADDSLV